MNNYRVALISMSDFTHLPPGGEVQLLHNFLAQKPSSDLSFHLIGMSFSPDMPAGRWTTLRVGEECYPFFPLCQILKPKEKTRIPFRLRMMAGIRRYYRRAGIVGFDAVYLQAPETVLPLLRYPGKIALHIHTDPDQTLRISRFPIFRAPFFSALYTGRILRGIRRADRILWSADAIRESFLAKRPALSAALGAKSAVVHSSYDPALIPGPVNFDFRDNVIRFITVGRLAKGKRVDFLIDVFSAFLRESPGTDAELIICGDGEELDHLRALAAEPGVAGHIIFTGDVDRPALATWLRHASVFLFASASETMSLVVLESLYMGVPVITTDVGDLGLVIRDGDTGYLIKEPSKADYLAAIRQVLSIPREQWSKRCKYAAASFSPKKMSDAICDDLRTMLQKD